MLINIFCFFCFLLIGFIVTQQHVSIMDIIYHKSLKMRKLHNNCVIFPAFQSTILRTFFELTKFFLKIGKKFTKTNC